MDEVTHSTSFPEQFIYHSLKQVFNNAVNRNRYKGYEYDIIIPEISLHIEYSGVYWHIDKLDRDEKKRQVCKENSAQFIQVYGHNGGVTDTYGFDIDDVYNKEQIIYRVNTNKNLHIEQLEYIVSFILENYAESHTVDEIDFDSAVIETNKVMYGAESVNENDNQEVDQIQKLKKNFKKMAYKQIDW